MAWIEKRQGKNGVSYRISVSCGIDGNGKQIMRRMSWKPTEGMTQRQTEKALARAVTDFERSIEQGVPSGPEADLCRIRRICYSVKRTCRRKAFCYMLV